MDAGLKARIRAELFRCAIAGEFPTYTEFFNRIHPGKQMGNFPYQTHFNEIAREERDLGYPDIKFIVRGVHGYQNQIDFRDAPKGPDDNQLWSLRDGADKLVELYCPPNTPARISRRNRFYRSGGMSKSLDGEVRGRSSSRQRRTLVISRHRK